MKTVKYGSRIKGRFYLILFIRLELDKILKSGNKAKKDKTKNRIEDRTFLRVILYDIKR